MSMRPGRVLSHYRLVEEIGQGGMGVVFKAYDESLGRHVALKTLPPDLAGDAERLRRFQREARAVAALNHPNIVTIHSVEEAEGIHFLTMELVQGKTLDDLIPPGGMALPAFFDLAVPLAEALDAAHEKGIVHRDLKPANVMVTGEGRVKVLDFGLAKLWRQEAAREEGAGAQATRTQGKDSGVVGTAPYMAPEVLQGQEADHRADIFSLGILLYEMVTGERPFKGRSGAEVMSSILRDTPAPVTEVRRDLPGMLGRVIRRCLEKDPKRRHQSALDVRNELEELRGSDPVAAAPAGPGREASGSAAAPARRRRTLVIGAVAAAGLLVLAMALTLRNRGAGAGSEASHPPESVSPGASGGAEAHAGISSIAILPFVNMSDDPENEYFSDGITEELINALVKVKSLKVPARTSVFALKGKQMTAQEIGRALGVQAVLEGSVRKSGETLRITAQLISVADGYHLWSERYDRKMRDVFAIQDEISQSIVKELQVSLTPTEQRAMQKPQPRDVQAYDYYLRGLKTFHLNGRRNLESARQMFSRAIEIDPSYAPAYAGEADASAFLYMYAGSRDQDLAKAGSASARALELAPDSAEAHASRGVALMLGKHYPEAAGEFETAMQLDPKLFEAAYFYARTLFVQGKSEEAARMYELASSLRPEDYQSVALLITVYQKLGRQAEARKTTERSVALIQRHLEQEPDDVRALYLGGGALVNLGRVEEGLALAQRALTIEPNDAGVLYNVACLYSLAGRVPEAIGYLEKALNAGFSQKEWIENDSDLDPLRKDPRFQSLMRRMRT
jgi:TolB-like protein/Flp pilus assembly protein TadD